MKTLRSHTISGVFVFLLLGIFAVFSTLTVLLGASAYKSSGERSDANNTSRILASYARSRLRSCDEAGSVAIEDVPGVIVTQDDDGNETVGEAGEIRCLTLTVYADEEETVIDRIYVYGGKLMERMVDASEPFEPERGIAICDADAMDCRIEDGLVRLEIASGDEKVNLEIALRCAGAEVVM